jgi:uncharacterized protein YcnI
MKKIIMSFIGSLSLVLLMPAVAFAHVVVTPRQAGIGQHLTFTVGVPNERQSAVVNVMVRIPSGVTDVTPTTKDGWTIDTTKSGGSATEITSIVWSGGTIPVGQRQDFSFSAQVPAEATDLNWSAYQTYEDGTVVHWDQKPNGSDDSKGNAGPYSVTHVVNDLQGGGSGSTKSGSNTAALILSIIALAVSLGSILLRKKA